MTRRVLERTGPWLIPAVVVGDVVLAATGTVATTSAVVAGAILEAVLWALVVWRVVAGMRRFGAARAAERDQWLAAEQALAALMPRPVARLVLLEPRLWTCLIAWVTRRPVRAGPGAFGYARGVSLVLLAASGLVVVEGAVADVVVGLALGPGSPWTVLVLAVHVYALAMLLGLRASFVRSPHVVDATAIHLRDAVLGTVDIPRGAVLAVGPGHRSHLGRSGIRVDPGTGSALLAFGDANVLLRLDPAHHLVVNGEPCPTPVTELWLTVDEPGRFAGTVAPVPTGAPAKAARPPELEPAPNTDRPYRSRSGGRAAPSPDRRQAGAGQLDE